MKQLVFCHDVIINNFNYSCFTDGSKINGHTGAALVLFSRFSSEPLTTFKWRLDDRNSVFQAEMMAINQASLLLSSLPIANSTICIFTDSLSSVHALSATSSSSKLCLDTRHSLDQLATSCKSLSLTWIRGHAGVRGNEMADTLAKEGSTSTVINAAPLPSSIFKSALQNSNFTERSRLCKTATTSNPLISLLHYFSEKPYTAFFKTLSRRNSRILTAFLDNRAPLKCFLYKIGKVHSPTCSYCHTGPQDNIHILLHCPALSYDRLTHLGPSPHIIPGTNSNKDLVTPLGLLKFLINIPLFTDFSDNPL